MWKKKLKKAAVAFVLVSTAVVSGLLGYFYFTQGPSPLKEQTLSASKAEVFLLNPHSVWSDEKVAVGFPIRGYGDAKATILGKVDLNGKELGKLKAIFLRATRPGHFSAMCHYPIYGLRFFHEDQIVVETSVCFSCMNYYIPVGTDDYTWAALSDFPSGLKSFLSKHLPIPEEFDDV